MVGTIEPTSGIIDGCCSMSASIRDGKVSFMVQCSTGNAYFSEKDLEAMLDFVRKSMTKEKSLS